MPSNVVSFFPFLSFVVYSVFIVCVKWIYTLLNDDIDDIRFFLTQVVEKSGHLHT